VQRHLEDGAKLREMEIMSTDLLELLVLLCSSTHYNTQR